MKRIIDFVCSIGNGDDVSKECFSVEIDDCNFNSCLLVEIWFCKSKLVRTAGIATDADSFVVLSIFSFVEFFFVFKEVKLTIVSVCLDEVGRDSIDLSCIFNGVHGSQVSNRLVFETCCGIVVLGRKGTDDFTGGKNNLGLVGIFSLFVSCTADDDFITDREVIHDVAVFDKAGD